MEGVAERAHTLAVVALSAVKASQAHTAPAIAAGSRALPVPLRRPRTS